MSARTPAAAKPKAAKASGAPVQLKKRRDAPREPLFAVDGVEYTMPVVVELGTSLALGRLLRLQPDEDSKGIELVRYLCGPQALSVLLDDATMTRTDWRRIVEILTERAFGPIEQREDEREGN